MINVEVISSVIGNVLILSFLVGIPLYGYCKKVPVYESFIEGAKEGVPTFLRILPFMIAMIVAISMLRASGAFELLGHLFAPLFSALGIPEEIVPIALIRPFSAAAATGVVADVLHQHGGDAFISQMATVVAGTTETTFYLVAIYFGAVNIKKTRHAIPAALVVDICGILTAVWLCRWLLL